MVMVLKRSAPGSSNKVVFERERVNQESIYAILDQDCSINRVVSQQDMMLESASILSKEPAFLSQQCQKFDGFTEIACTLMARDYKGIGNQRGLGVLEIYEEEKNNCTSPILIGGMQEHQSVKKDGICTCLCSSMGERWRLYTNDNRKSK